MGNRKQMRDQSQIIPDLEYADDMCLLSSFVDELEMLLDLDWSCKEVGLTISAQKTKILAITNNQLDIPRRITLQSSDETVEVVEAVLEISM